MTYKKIGLPVWKTGDNSVGSTLSYVQFAEMFGEVVFLMPKHTLRPDLDLLILPGGPDLPSTVYEERPHWFTGKSDPQKDYFDKVYLPQYIAAGVPVFAICRGAQAIAAHFGGKLIQHMSHETNKADDPYKAVHKMTIDSQTYPQLTAFTDKKLIPVNSRHHQAVRESSLVNTDLVVTARHEKDKHVEMIAHKTLPIVGLQSHPEDCFEDETTDFVFNIIKWLIETKTSILS